MPTSPSKDQLFSQAALEWDLPRLYQDLGKIKGKSLSSKTEKVHLRGLLCGYSPAEIAKQLHKTEAGLEVALSNTIYHYVKTLLGKTEDKVNNWNQIRRWLAAAGYKMILTNQQTPGFSGPINISSRVINMTLIGNGLMLVNIHTSLVLPTSANVGGEQEKRGSEGSGGKTEEGKEE